MKSKKAFIKQNGEIGEKENPAIEYNDTDYLKNQQKQVDDFNELLSKMKAMKDMDDTTNTSDKADINL